MVVCAFQLIEEMSQELTWMLAFGQRESQQGLVVAGEGFITGDTQVLHVLGHKLICGDVDRI